MRIRSLFMDGLCKRNTFYYSTEYINSQNLSVHVQFSRVNAIRQSVIFTSCVLLALSGLSAPNNALLPLNVDKFGWLWVTGAVPVDGRGFHQCQALCCLHVLLLLIIIDRLMLTTILYLMHLNITLAGLGTVDVSMLYLFLYIPC